MRNLPVPGTSLRLDYPLMIVASIALILMSIPWGGGAGIIGPVEGAILVFGLICFMFFAVKMGKVDADEVGDVEISGLGMPAAIGLIIAGIALMAVGGDVALTGAVAIAEAIGMSERVIGLTVVALGTSLPELATSIQAVRRDETAIAVANVVGSNLFNILCIVGIASLIVPIPVNPSTLSYDFYWMMGFILILLPLMLRGRVIRRGEGIFLLIALVTYITTLLVL